MAGVGVCAVRNSECVSCGCEIGERCAWSLCQKKLLKICDFVIKDFNTCNWVVLVNENCSKISFELRLFGKSLAGFWWFLQPTRVRIDPNIFSLNLL